MTVIDEIQFHAMRQRTSAALVINHAGAADEVVSYETLLDAVLRRAQVLRRNGLREGDRCGLVARQGREFIEGALAILASGACMVPLAHDASPDAIAAVHARCQLHALLRGSDAWSLETFAETRPIDGQEDREYRALHPAYVRFTSGTTNVRKGVLIGHEAIRARLAAANAALALGPGDRVLWLLPMEHHFVVSILLYLSVGATIVLPDSVLPNDLLETASRHRATFLYASPYHYKLLCRASGPGDLSHVRMAISTTSGLTPDVAEAFAQRFKIPLGQALGIIEVGLPVINTGRAGERLASLGRPLPAYDVWLRDDAGGRVTATGPDALGEICIRGPGLFDAYLDPWMRATKVLQPDGFRTGDQGWFDADGCLQLAGRRSNRINTAGMKFFAEEVEAVLEQHPKVQASRVRPIAHAQLGEIALAEIAPCDSADPPHWPELIALCRERLEPYKVPRKFELVEAVPTTATGKVRRWDQP